MAEIKTQGALVYEHRTFLRMDIWTYSILLQVPPEHVDGVERGEMAIDDEMRAALLKWRLRNFDDLPQGMVNYPVKNGWRRTKRSFVRRFDPWRDVPFDEHLKAQREIRPGDERTLAEVGRLLGVCRERVRQIEFEARSKVSDELGMGSDDWHESAPATSNPLERDSDMSSGTEGDSLIETTFRRQ